MKYLCKKHTVTRTCDEKKVRDIYKSFSFSTLRSSKNNRVNFYWCSIVEASNAFDINRLKEAQQHV